MVKGVITTLLAIVPNMVAVVEAVVRVIMQVFPLDRQEDLGVAASMEQEVEVEVSGTVPQEEVRAVRALLLRSCADLAVAVRVQRVEDSLA